MRTQDRERQQTRDLQRQAGNHDMNAVPFFSIRIGCIGQRTADSLQDEAEEVH